MSDNEDNAANITNVNLTLDKLKLKRAQTKSQLTRFVSFLDRFNTTNGNHEEINVRLEKINFTLETFNDLQTEIESITGVIQDDETETFEIKFYESVGRAKKMVADFLTAEGANRNSASSAGSIISGTNANVALQGPVRLPPINLNDFHGAYSQWMTFHDIFNSLVHTNNSLNDVQRFWYLKSCLKGEAAQLIQSLEISDLNYSIAWDMLKKRYENKRLIVHTHLKSMFEGTSLKNESRAQLRAILDTFNKDLRALTVLGQPTDTWDTLLIYILNSKLDINTKREWEEFLNRENIDFPTISQLTEFLTKKCNFLAELGKALSKRA